MNFGAFLNIPYSNSIFNDKHRTDYTKYKGVLKDIDRTAKPTTQWPPSRILAIFDDSHLRRESTPNDGAKMKMKMKMMKQKMKMKMIKMEMKMLMMMMMKVIIVLMTCDISSVAMFIEERCKKTEKTNNC